MFLSDNQDYLLFSDEKEELYILVLIKKYFTLYHGVWEYCWFRVFHTLKIVFAYNLKLLFKEIWKSSILLTLIRVRLVSIRSHLHMTSLYICIQSKYTPTNHRHAFICFMKGVTLQYLRLHISKQAWTIFSLFLWRLPKDFSRRSNGRVKMNLYRYP